MCSQLDCIQLDGLRNATRFSCSRSELMCRSAFVGAACGSKMPSDSGMLADMVFDMPVNAMMIALRRSSWPHIKSSLCQVRACEADQPAVMLHPYAGVSYGGLVGIDGRAGVQLSA